MSPRTIRRFVFAAIGLGVLLGCNSASDGPPVVNVTGTVMFNGSPVDEANVAFYPADSGGQTLPSQAVTDSSGQFALSTHVGGGKFKSGIVPGKYEVAVTKLDTASIKSTLAPPKNLLPKKYASPKSSGLNADVVAGQANDFKFGLERK